MENIHILSTDKPSRLIQAEDDELMLLNELYENTYNINKHIYITSDVEIKEGDYYYDNIVLQVRQWKSFMIYNNVQHFKIILTTDQDLIDDGVQAIADEFLEWFIKNPNCREIEVVDVRSLGVYGSYYPYKIIIPKEDTKQETLEEAAERLYPTTINSFTDSGFDMSETERLIFINGAKWQQEQNKNLYSEEDMIEFADFYCQYKELIKLEKWEIIEISKKDVFKKWFEKLKKK